MTAQFKQYDVFDVLPEPDEDVLIDFCVDRARRSQEEEWRILEDLVLVAPKEPSHNHDPYDALMAVTVSCIKSGVTLGLSLGKGRLTDKRALDYLTRIDRKFKKKRAEYCFESNQSYLDQMLKDLGKEKGGNGSH